MIVSVLKLSNLHIRAVATTENTEVICFSWEFVSFNSLKEFTFYNYTFIFWFLYFLTEYIKIYSKNRGKHIGVAVAQELKQVIHQSGLISGSSSPHVQVSLGKIPNPRLLCECVCVCV